MRPGTRPTTHPRIRGYLTRRLAPAIEVVERRQLLATGFGVIAGTAFVDSNHNDTLDLTDGYLPGATVRLFRAGSPTPIASQTTGADGGYSFAGLAPGSYVVSETPPDGARVSGTQVLSQVDPASGLAGNAIRVTIPASPLTLNYNGVLPANYQVSKDLVNRTPESDSIGQFRVSLGTSPGATDVNPGFLTYCLDDLHRLSFAGGERFPIDPLPISAAGNGLNTIPADRAGRIAFLYNHFGNASLGNVAGPALQLAIWELLYDNNPEPDFSAGNFQVLGPDTPFTDRPTLDRVLAQASDYFKMSEGKSEAALLLDASPSQVAGQPYGSQSMIAEGSFNFANQPVKLAATSSLGGLVYCDANHDGTHDTGDLAVPGALLALTGTDRAGTVVKLTTRSDVKGGYRFPDLNPGTYTITLLTAPPGLVPATDSQGTPGNGTVGVNRIRNISLPEGFVGVSDNFGLTGQVVSATRLELLGIHRQPSRIVVHFDGPLNAIAANDPSRYSLIGLGKDETYGTADDVHYRVAVSYDPMNATVTIAPGHHLNIHYHYVLRFRLPGFGPCAPQVELTSVLGRSAVPYFNIHGSILPNPAMDRNELRHDARVRARVLAAMASNQHDRVS